MMNLEVQKTIKREVTDYTPASRRVSRFRGPRTVSKFYLFLLLSALGGLLSCTEDPSPEAVESRPLFRPLSAEQSGVDFANTIVEDDTFNMVDFFYIYNGGGVAMGDINNDSLPDLFFTGNMVEDRLYLNTGPGVAAFGFKDISQAAGIQSAGWSTGVTMVDINADGWLDIYVCRSGNYPAKRRRNQLWINNGVDQATQLPTFTEAAHDYGIADTSYTTQAAFFDYDRDGDLDLYLLNHTNAVRNPNEVRPRVSDGSGPANDRLYRNNGDLTFTDVTLDAGIRYDGLGLGVSVSDVNEDGWPDIFVTNDFIAHNYLYINQQNGQFAESSASYFGHMSHFSMGHDVADINNDGLNDIVTADMLPPDHYHRKKMAGPMNYNLFARTQKEGYLPQYMRNTVQLNRGHINGRPLGFAEIGQLLNLHATDWSWAPLLADFNNDGWKDLFITNGYLRDITDLDFVNYTAQLGGTITADSLDDVLKDQARQMPSIALSNRGFANQGGLRFTDATQAWGIEQPSLSNGAAYGDLDRDGDLDLVVNTINTPALVYENQADQRPDRNFLSLNLRGDSLNPGALGAKVWVYAEGLPQVAEQSVTRGYQSSVEPTLHFGLGAVDTIDSLVVRWPNGTTARRGKVSANQRLTVRYQDAELRPVPDKTLQPWFTEVTDELNVDYQHVDPEYNDFSRQYLLPHKLSEQGPGIAVGDMNGDAREDFFVGGAYNHSGTLFFQNQNGTFGKKPLTRSEAEKSAEDQGALLFDYDGDGDLDLYVASGSNEHYPGSEYYQDRLYTNDGRGNFTLASGALPPLRSSSSCVRAADFDQDGDLDLLVGTRAEPLKYPLPSDSYLLVNERGSFTDRTGELAPGLRKLGMVKDALWTDFDGDRDADLVVVGEFMPIQFFENSNGTLKNVSNETGLTYTSGWWNSINSGDFDQDGDLDYVVGNLGKNAPYSATTTEPLTIYAADLDQNGFVDPVITYFNDHQEYPVSARDDLIRQVPTLKKKFPSYERYATADVSAIVSPADRSRAYVAKAFQLASGYLENLGGGRFRLNDLPWPAQLAPVYGILVQDFDDDGHLDVLLSGNDFGAEVVNGRYDASVGTLLRGDGEGQFAALSFRESGLSVSGNARGSAVLQTPDQPIYLFASSGGPLQAYATTKRRKPKKTIEVPSDVFRALVTFGDGRQCIREFYYGSSYLSQSSRYLPLRGDEKQITLIDFRGKERPASF
ncbi:MAG: VCBS repeat-containing protein [Tunicatimonas sp.]